MRAAILLTSNNRRNMTMACLSAVRRQFPTLPVEPAVFLVDAGSTDGTVQMILHSFPEVRLIVRDNNLFWCGGMREVFSRAQMEDFDYYVWLNDDTVLDDAAMENMMALSRRLHSESSGMHILVGSTRDPETGVLTYGGMVRSSRWHPFRYRRVEPTSSPQPCHTFEGNCVLLPRAVARQIGNLDKSFSHGIGDTDYGLRAVKAGCQLWVVPGFVGTCSRDSSTRDWESGALSWRQRWAKICSVKGLPPQEHRVFVKRHGGTLWPLFWCMPYVRALFFPRRTPRAAITERQLQL